VCAITLLEQWNNFYRIMMADEEWFIQNTGLQPVASLQEIANAMGLTKKQVRTALKNALRKVRENSDT